MNNKRPLTIIVTRLFRGAFFVAVLFIAIDAIRLAQGQPQSSKKFPTNSEASRNSLHSAKGAKTIVRVHDSAERSQIGSPQQDYSVTSAGAPSGVFCGVVSRAAHGQIAPDTNGGTLNPVAFINPRRSMHPGASRSTRR